MLNKIASYRENLEIKTLYPDYKEFVQEKDPDQAQGTNLWTIPCKSISHTHFKTGKKEF